jgi:GNAT superfamily N-acetyltransferase
MPLGDNIHLREAQPGTDDDAVVALMVEYLTWAHERLHSEYGIDEPPTDPAEERDKLQQYRRPHGLLLLAQCEGHPAGVGALRWLDHGIAEVKRMYVPPRWRGTHLGSAILDRLLDEARRHAATTVRLDTVRFMADAQRLYRSRGFAQRPPYEGTEIPLRLQEHWLFFETGL